MAIKYREISIKAHHSGFGMYEAENPNSAEGDLYAYEEDLLSEISRNLGVEIYPLDEPEQLPTDIEDIRGNIYNEPDRVFAYRDSQGFYDENGNATESINYFGISEVETA